MSPDVHLDPDALRAAAAAAAVVADRIPLTCLDDGQIEACGHVEGGPELVAEHDRILEVLRLAADELVGLAAAAAGIARLCEDADRLACRLVERAGGGLP